MCWCGGWLGDGDEAGHVDVGFGEESFDGGDGESVDEVVAVDQSVELVAAVFDRFDAPSSVGGVVGADDVALGWVGDRLGCFADAGGGAVVAEAAPGGVAQALVGGPVAEGDL